MNKINKNNGTNEAPVPFEVSIPLDQEEIQKAHDAIKKMFIANNDALLKASSDYLYEKSKEANDKDHRRDAFILEDLGKLALEVIPDVLERKQADKY